MEDDLYDDRTTRKYFLNTEASEAVDEVDFTLKNQQVDSSLLLPSETK